MFRLDLPFTGTSLAFQFFFFLKHLVAKNKMMLALFFLATSAAANASLLLGALLNFIEEIIPFQSLN